MMPPSADGIRGYRHQYRGPAMTAAQPRCDFGVTRVLPPPLTPAPVRSARLGLGLSAAAGGIVLAVPRRLGFPLMPALLVGARRRSPCGAEPGSRPGFAATTTPAPGGRTSTGKTRPCRRPPSWAPAGDSHPAPQCPAPVVQPVDGEDHSAGAGVKIADAGQECAAEVGVGADGNAGLAGGAPEGGGPAGEP